MSHRAHLLAVALLAALIPAAHAGEFVYQGQLDDRGVAASGRYDLRIAAFGDEKSPQTLLAPIEFPGVEVKDGRFELRFDAPLAGDREAWLEVAVRDAGAGVWAGIPGRSKAIAAPLIGACWSVTGDSGSDPATNFLGTTDVQPLVLRTGNAQSLRLAPSSITSGAPALPITTNVIAGSHVNTVGADVRGATIGGGGAPEFSDPGVAGESPNRVLDNYGTVGGGIKNQAGGSATGTQNGTMAIVGGGYNNTAGAYASVVGGGSFNAAVERLSVVPGGLDNCAGGRFSWAGGWKAKVRLSNVLAGVLPDACAAVPVADDLGDEGTFVWADAQNLPAGLPFVSTGPNQFLVRADGGAMFNRNAPVSVNDDFVIGARTIDSGGDADVDLRLVSRNGRSASMYVVDTTGTLRFNLTNLTAGNDRLSVAGGVGGAATLSNGGAWTNASSRTFKEGFAAIDPADVLQRVLALGISRWSYIGSGEGEHVGPMAEDFHAAFGLGHSERQIATVDADGVALAAIQGLNAKLEAENAALREEMAALRALVESRLHGGH
jgi:hypothetical protein